MGEAVRKGKDYNGGEGSAEYIGSMNPQSDREKQMQDREARLQEREHELRLRELEAELYDKEPPLSPTKPLKRKQAKWIRKAKRVGQFALFAVGTLVLIRIASWLMWFALAGLILFLGYKIFLGDGDEDE